MGAGRGDGADPVKPTGHASQGPGNSIFPHHDRSSGIILDVHSGEPPSAGKGPAPAAAVGQVQQAKVVGKTKDADMPASLPLVSNGSGAEGKNAEWKMRHAVQKAAEHGDDAGVPNADARLSVGPPIRGTPAPAGGVQAPEAEGPARPTAENGVLLDAAESKGKALATAVRTPSGPAHPTPLGVTLSAPLGPGSGRPFDEHPHAQAIRTNLESSDDFLVVPALPTYVEAAESVHKFMGDPPGDAGSRGGTAMHAPRRMRPLYVLELLSADFVKDCFSGLGVRVEEEVNSDLMTKVGDDIRKYSPKDIVGALLIRNRETILGRTSETVKADLCAVSLLHAARGVKPEKDDCNRVSRKHGFIRYDKKRRRFHLRTVGRNEDQILLNFKTRPAGSQNLLKDGDVVCLGSAVIVWREYRVGPDPNASPSGAPAPSAGAVKSAAAVGNKRKSPSALEPAVNADGLKKTPPSRWPDKGVKQKPKVKRRKVGAAASDVGAGAGARPGASTSAGAGAAGGAMGGGATGARHAGVGAPRRKWGSNQFPVTLTLPRAEGRRAIKPSQRLVDLEETYRVEVTPELMRGVVDEVDRYDSDGVERDVIGRPNAARWARMTLQYSSDDEVRFDPQRGWRGTREMTIDPSKWVSSAGERTGVELEADCAKDLLDLRRHGADPIEGMPNADHDVYLAHGLRTVLCFCGSDFEVLAALKGKHIWAEFLIDRVGALAGCACLPTYVAFREEGLLRDSNCDPEGFRSLLEWEGCTVLRFAVRVGKLRDEVFFLCRLHDRRSEEGDDQDLDVQGGRLRFVHRHLLLQKRPEAMLAFLDNLVVQDAGSMCEIKDVDHFCKAVNSFVGDPAMMKLAQQISI